MLTLHETGKPNILCSGNALPAGAALRKPASGLFPREHGAWAMLIQPFLGALIVLHRLSWPALPALAAVVLVFLIRDPLIVLARQKMVWRTERPETALARRYLLVELLALAAAAAWLTLAWPVWWLVALGAGAAILTALAVYMTVKNRQRSIWLQAVSAAGLSSSALAASLAVNATLPEWVWWFWALHSAHFLASILVVHVRLEARIAARKPAAHPSAGVLAPEILSFRKKTAILEGLVMAAAIALLFAGKWLYSAAALLSAGFNLYDLFTLHTPRAIAVSMMTVGKRALAVSIAFTLLLAAGSL